MNRRVDAVKRYVNLGCGGRYHPDWINIDIVAHGPQVIQHDLARGIPLPDASCDVVYHAAVFEHIRRIDAPSFLHECWRVLEPGGIIRIGVPDLEQLCRLYLEKLALAAAGDKDAVHDYDWVMFELYDQTVREQSGGEMLDYLRQDPLPNEAFVYERIGDEGRQLVQTLRGQKQHQAQTSPATPEPLWRRLGRNVTVLRGEFKQRLLARLLGADGLRALAIGRFRLAGEVHQWMYDRYSLARLLLATGFVDPVVQGPTVSRIAGWQHYYLDTLPDGSVIKPDLLFLEAIKPIE